jgi:uncharacterized membrane protein YjjP (DUF1212 family)
MEGAAVDDAIEFLLELESALHAVSVPADMTAALITRAAERVGARIDLAIFQSYVAVDVARGNTHEVRIKRIPFEAGLDVWRAQKLMALARDLGDGRSDLAQAREALARIKNQRPPYPRALVLFAYGVYSAAVAARVGGAALDVIAAIPVGVVAGLISYGAGRYRSVELQKSFLAGLLGAPLALLISIAMPIAAGKVLFAGVVLLVPAIALTISIHELANDALESGVLRLIYGLLRFLMLGFGVAAAMQLWQLFAPLPTVEASTPMPVAIVMLLLAAGGAALVVCVRARPRDAGWVILAVLLAYGTQEFTKLFVGHEGSPFTAAFVIGVAGQIYGRKSGRMPVIFTVPGLLQLVPGFLGTQAVLKLLLGQTSAPAATFSGVFFVALQIVTGLLVSELLFRRRPSGAELRPAAAPR